MKKFVEFLKKIIGIAAKVSTNPEVKSKLEIADKMLNENRDTK